jgi:hypothetical protein
MAFNSTESPGANWHEAHNAFPRRDLARSPLGSSPVIAAHVAMLGRTGQSSPAEAPARQVQPLIEPTRLGVKCARHPDVWLSMYFQLVSGLSMTTCTFGSLLAAGEYVCNSALHRFVS